MTAESSSDNHGQPRVPLSSSASEARPNDGGHDERRHDERRHDGVLGGVRVIAVLTMLSRVLGLVRDIATAGLFGLGPVMDAFALAFRIPNLTRKLFGEGALSTAFLPVFTAAREADLKTGQRQAWRLASAVFVCVSAGLSVVVLLGIAGLMWYGGSQPIGSNNRLLAGLAAVMLPYAVLICLAAQVTAVLHAQQHFTWPAAVPVVLNLCWMLSVWIVDPLFEPDRVAQAYALAVGVLIAGVLQLLLQIPTLYQLGFRFELNWRESAPGLRRLWNTLLPVTFGLSVTQITSLQDSAIAWIFANPGTEPVPMWASGPLYPLQAGTVAAMYFGERLYQLPLGVFGVALGTALFPVLSMYASRGDLAGVRSAVRLGMRLVLVIGVPASAGLWLTSDSVTAVFFQRGEFSAEDAVRTAGMIRMYGLGVWAYCAIPVLYRAFYACGYSRPTVWLGLMCIAVDCALNLSLIWWMAEQGLAISTALTAAIQVAAMLWMLQRKVGPLELGLVRNVGLKTLLATFGMFVTYRLTEWCLAATMAGTAAGTSSLKLLAVQLLVPMTAAVAAYMLLAAVLKLDDFWRVFRRSGTKTADPVE